MRLLASAYSTAGLWRSREWDKKGVYSEKDEERGEENNGKDKL